jgi:predicted DNA-binding protein (MmcQ/YjbR family)
MAASKVKQVREKLYRYALSLPEATEDFPWGERVVKVNKKVFAFLGRDMDPHFGLGVKLKASHAAALHEPFASPMGYGLGKSGWVSAKFEADARPSFEELKAWVKESYCAVAPKALAKLITPPDPAAPAKAAKKTKSKAKVKAKTKAQAKPKATQARTAKR